MSKKLLYTVLAGALSISVLAACGDATDDPAPLEEDSGLETEEEPIVE
ncbi:hypothetical protein [Bacillus solitudinis]|nr:hypothetical protein [Bacillus solitudinis]